MFKVHKFPIDPQKLKPYGSTLGTFDLEVPGFYRYLSVAVQSGVLVLYCIVDEDQLERKVPVQLLIAGTGQKLPLEAFSPPEKFATFLGTHVLRVYWNAQWRLSTYHVWGMDA
jgi:hypothetical protein